MPVERLLPLARQLLVVPIDESTSDLWLWEHAERVMQLANMIATLPEVTGQPLDSTALNAAALFHDAGWTVEYHQGRWKRWQLLSRPTNDIQRELGAAMLQEEAGHLLRTQTTRRACEAIRHCNDRRTDLLEARILAEAEALDEVGTMYLLRQVRQYQAEGRPIQQIVDSWQRQKEYHFWDLRLNDGFRYESVRELARARLQAVDSFVSALQRDIHGDDLRQRLSSPGQAVSNQTG
jgi:HD superfamily phosphodiesterase